MLAKINEMNKNVVILLSVAIIAITSIVVTLIATSDARKGSVNSITEFQDYFMSTYGVKPDIIINVHNVSDSQAKTISDSLSSKLHLNDAQLEESNGTTWYATESKDGKIEANAFVK